MSSRGSALPSSRRPANTGRCFRTTADGRIALVSDWTEIAGRLQPLDRIVIQTRNTSVRLIAVVSGAELARDLADAGPAAPAEHLRIHAPAAMAAWARLAPCACCGSPGRIEGSNSAGLDCLHLCPTAECPVTRWSAMLETLAAPSPSRSAASFSAIPVEFPRIRPQAHRVAGGSMAFARLCQLLSEHGIAMRVTLTTAESTHQRVFVPALENAEADVLTAREDSTVLQVAPPAVRGYAVEGDLAAPTLQVIGPGDALLFACGAAPGEASAWGDALRHVFPALSAMI